MKTKRWRVLLGLLLSVALGAPALGQARSHASSRDVQFRTDDLNAQRLARKLLGRRIAEEEGWSAGPNLLWTAWTKLSSREAPYLLVMYGCSPTGNCGLYGYKPDRDGWKLVLNSLAQKCSILSSAHGGRRDISAYMHGSATDGDLKTYRWRGNRYVRVSDRHIFLK